MQDRREARRLNLQKKQLQQLKQHLNGLSNYYQVRNLLGTNMILVPSLSLSLFPSLSPSPPSRRRRDLSAHGRLRNISLPTSTGTFPDVFKVHSESHLQQIFEFSQY
jgi:hypothetical protein